MTSVPDTVLAVWRHRPREAGDIVILPDGCRDPIFNVRPGKRPAWFVSPLMNTVQFHAHEADELFWGLRLAPGVRVDEAALLRAVSDGRICNMADALPLVDSFSRHSSDMSHALDTLAQGRSVRHTARSGPVGTQPDKARPQPHLPPAGLVEEPRARCAALSLDTGAALAEIAADHGFADQAHMTRTFRRWFGMPPARFRASPDLIATARQPGFGQDA